MVYERFVKQLDGCTYCSGGLNCNCAAEAMWLYRASQGRIITTSCNVRRRTGDKVDGTRLEQIDNVSRQYGITTGRIYKPIAISTLFSLIEGGRHGAVLQIDYSPIAPTKFDCFSNGFFGAHSIYLSNKGGASGTIRAADPGADGRRAGIPKGFQDYPKSLLTTAAGMLYIGSSQTVNTRYGKGKAFAYVTPLDPILSAVKYKAVITGYTRLYSRPGGTVVGALSKASYIVSRSKVDGLWWYTIISKVDGGITSLKGRAFKPNSHTAITLA